MTFNVYIERDGPIKVKFVKCVEFQWGEIWKLGLLHCYSSRLMWKKSEPEFETLMNLYYLQSGQWPSIEAGFLVVSLVTVTTCIDGLCAFSC